MKKVNQCEENIKGEQVLGECINNGKMLCTLCQEHNLITGGTKRMHQDIHKTTCNSLDGSTRNQIDHTIVSKRWRSRLLDVIAKQRTGVESGRSLVSAKIKLKFKKSRKKDKRLFATGKNNHKLKDSKGHWNILTKSPKRFKSPLMANSNKIDIKHLMKYWSRKQTTSIWSKEKEKRRLYTRRHMGESRIRVWKEKRDSVN